MATDARIAHVTSGTFDQEVVASTQPVVVDLYAEWCGPCRLLSPALEKLAETYQGLVRFVKVNVDEDPEIAARYGITGVPTLLFFKGGRLQDTRVGLLPLAELRARIERLAA
jgi:thioredoxin 1